MKKSFFAIIIIAGAITLGFFASSLFAKQPEKMVIQDPVSMTEPFVVNLADKGKDSYIKLSVGFTLKGISQSDYNKLHPDAGAHGGSSPSVSPLASDPVIRDAVIIVVSRFTSQELLRPAGKQRFKQELLHAIHLKDPKSPVQDILFTDMAIQ